MAWSLRKKRLAPPATSDWEQRDEAGIHRILLRWLELGSRLEIPSHQLTWKCTDPVERLRSPWKGHFCTSMFVGGRIVDFTIDLQNYAQVSSPATRFSVAHLRLLGIRSL